MTEIKISELSVGDWVMNLYANKPSRVIGLRTMFQDTYEIIAVSDDTQYMLIEDKELHNYEPIPLTPEILEKNGFEKGEIYEGNSSIVFTNGNIRISWYKNAMWCRLRIYNALGDTELCSAIVHNVHQLQHALRLAGVGKEIEV